MNPLIAGDQIRSEGVERFPVRSREFPSCFENKGGPGQNIPRPIVVGPIGIEPPSSDIGHVQRGRAGPTQPLGMFGDPLPGGEVPLLRAPTRGEPRGDQPIRESGGFTHLNPFPVLSYSRMDLLSIMCEAAIAIKT